MTKRENNMGRKFGCILSAGVISVIVASVMGVGHGVLIFLGVFFVILIIIVLIDNTDNDDKSDASQRETSHSSSTGRYAVIENDNTIRYVTGGDRKDEVEDRDDEKIYDDIDSSLSGKDIKITSHEFDQCKRAVKRLMRLCKKISHDDQMRYGVMKRANGMDTYQGQYDSGEFYDTLIIMLAKDIIHIYEHLGLDTEMDFDTPEGQLLWPIALTLAAREEDTFSQFKVEMSSNNPIDAEIRDCHKEIYKVYKDVNSVGVKVEGVDDFNLVLLVKLMDCEHLYLKDLRDGLNQMAEIIADVADMKDEVAVRLNSLKSRIEDDMKEQKDSELSDENVTAATMADLEDLIGLHQVKKEVSALKNFIEVSRRREQAGLKTPSVSYHCVFTGNPGTGKTTVARIVAGIYKELGVLKKGHLVETDRSGLVAEYVGQTAVKTNKVIDSALDGVLFIDEAYSLIGAGNEDFGKEAIATLVKRMEDDRDRLVVILAGYEEEMQEFINSNPGLRSRFNRYIHFEDYSADELKQIYLGLLQKYDFVLQAEGNKVLTDHFEQCVANRGKDFGNARYVRNLFERTIKAQSVRLAAQPDSDTAELATITAGDIAVVIAEKP